MVYAPREKLMFAPRIGAPTPSPSPTPTPSFSYPTADGIQAPTPYPAALGEYNSTGSPCTSVAEVRTAFHNAAAGQIIYLAPGTYSYLDLTTGGGINLAKGAGNPIRLKPADPTDRPRFKVTHASNTSTLYLDGASGIAVEGMKFTIDDFPNSLTDPAAINAAYRRMCTPSGTNSNIWFVGNELYSNITDSGTSALMTNNIEVWKGPLISGLHILGNYVHDIGQGWVNVGDDSDFAFNRFARVQSDWCSLGEGHRNFKYYFNYTLEPQSFDGNHSDGLQIFTNVATTRTTDGIYIYNNRAACPANIRPDPGTLSSLARMQFIIIGNEAGIANQNNNIYIHSNKGYGCIDNTILAGAAGIYVKNNEAYHIAGTYLGAADSVLHTKIYIDGTGSASGNIAYEFFNVSGGAITGQATTASDPTKTLIFADAQALVFAWLASGDFAQARALMNLPTNPFLPF